MKLFLKNLFFTICIPGAVAVYIPLFIARGTSITSYPFIAEPGLYQPSYAVIRKFYWRLGVR